MGLEQKTGWPVETLYLGMVEMGDGRWAQDGVWRMGISRYALILDVNVNVLTVLVMRVVLRMPF